MKWIYFACLVLIVLPGCNFKEREKAIQEKENALALKEQQLNDRELALQLAEGEFAKKQLVDTLHTDSLFMVDNNILGQWNTKMICTQTTCSGSAIGDTKVETWTFYYENNQIVAKATSGEKLVRIYTGKVFNNAMELVENIESTLNEPTTKIVVRLKKQNERLLEGQREILRPDCKIVYSLQLTR